MMQTLVNNVSQSYLMIRHANTHNPPQAKIPVYEYQSSSREY